MAGKEDDDDVYDEREVWYVPPSGKAEREEGATVASGIGSTSDGKKRKTLSCGGEAKALKSCLAASQCVKDGNSMADCLSQVEDCEGVRYAYFTCKAGQYNARSRLRGIKGKRL